MGSSRRKFIKTLSAGVVGSGLLTALPRDIFAASQKFDDGIELKKGYVVLNGDTQKVMSALADALVPGSQAKGIQNKIMNYCNRDRAAASFLDAGLWNVNSLSQAKFKKPFYELDKPEDIKTLVNHIRARNNIFYKQFRLLVIKLHYTDPDVWETLNYNGPPQPKGFMNYADKPK